MLHELATVWTVDSKLVMSDRLEKRYDEVQNIVENFKQGGKTAEWDALLQELNTYETEAPETSNDKSKDEEEDRG